MTKEDTPIANAFAELPATRKGLRYICDRWEDEKEYEDWSDYVMYMRDVIARGPGITFREASHRPFGFTFGTGEGVFRITVNALEIKLERLS